MNVCMKNVIMTKVVMTKVIMTNVAMTNVVYDEHRFDKHVLSQANRAGYVWNIFAGFVLGQGGYRLGIVQLDFRLG